MGSSGTIFNHLTLNGFSIDDPGLNLYFHEGFQNDDFLILIFLLHS